MSKGGAEGGKIGGLATKEDYGKKPATTLRHPFSVDSDDDEKERDYSQNTDRVLAKEAGMSHKVHILI